MEQSERKLERLSQSERSNDSNSLSLSLSNLKPILKKRKEEEADEKLQVGRTPPLEPAASFPMITNSHEGSGQSNNVRWTNSAGAGLSDLPTTDPSHQTGSSPVGALSSPTELVQFTGAITLSGVAPAADSGC
jgi:hypothetical protein